MDHVDPSTAAHLRRLPAEPDPAVYVNPTRERVRLEVDSAPDVELHMHDDGELLDLFVGAGRTTLDLVPRSEDPDSVDELAGLIRVLESAWAAARGARGLGPDDDGARPGYALVEFGDGSRLVYEVSGPAGEGSPVEVLDGPHRVGEVGRVVEARREPDIDVAVDVHRATVVQDACEQPEDSEPEVEVVRYGGAEDGDDLPADPPHGGYPDPS